MLHWLLRRVFIDAERVLGYHQGFEDGYQRAIEDFTLWSESYPGAA